MKPPQRKLSDLFKFGKPNTPGYEISKDYYLSVLAATSTLPACRQVMTPKGGGGAVPGMLAPLGSASKEELETPMKRGIYAMASSDQKTVLKLMVMPRDEAGFDPEPFLRSALGRAAPDEIRNRIAATWHVMQLTFEAFHQEIFPALEFFLLTARRLAELTDGIVADPICMRYLLPSEVLMAPRRQEDFDVREHISTVQDSTTHTRGLVKFNLPELSLASQSTVAEAFLVNVTESIFRGNVLSAGSQVGPFLVRQGGLGMAQWDGVPVFDLMPAGNQSIDEALKIWRQNHET